MRRRQLLCRTQASRRGQCPLLETLGKHEILDTVASGNGNVSGTVIASASVKGQAPMPEAQITIGLIAVA